MSAYNYRWYRNPKAKGYYARSHVILGDEPSMPTYSLCGRKAAWLLTTNHLDDTGQPWGTEQCDSCRKAITPYMSYAGNFHDVPLATRAVSALQNDESYIAPDGRRWRYIDTWARLDA